MDTSHLYNQFEDIETRLFFDIETTGFSYRKNMVYLIGCVYIEDHQVYLTQWLAEEDHDEYTLLFNFIQLSQGYRQLVHFNGSTFDIPFISKKAKCYHLTFDGNDYIHCDLYKHIRPCKHILGLENCRLKTVEKYLGIHRNDPYSGSELIEQFLQFMASKDKTIKNHLLLHNEEDITSLVHMTKLLSPIQLYHHIKTSYEDYILYDCKVVEQVLVIQLRLSPLFPFKYTYKHKHYHIEVNEDKITLHIPLLEEELKYYFEAYKDYYYIPSEDQAMHKQVAKYIHTSNRIKATKDTCYIKKRGIFIPLVHTNRLDDVRVFHRSRKDATTYVLYHEDLLSNDHLLKKLCFIFLRHL
ncbi:ribonuclease H-like domain-containing protein [Vallitalea pronyensis]|uniref:Ribonuclease H-like domain-containing protein n=1 Tax=Vallitalea pronyensis TaxID=1348613 RepID=A0A8J8MJR9_9FIRM|nr:ribonuclease H-like domain-containing protein [Vallitalea pronyensis]QUI23102.1 ribonuclease H-like domain-containing protein [Vallitalea pronyensis]